MTDQPKLRIAARDPGAANLLAGLLDEAGLTENYACDLWVTANVASYFVKAGLPVRIFDQPPTAIEMLREWQADPADALVTGTSHYEPFDDLLWRAARLTGTPSLAAVDYWSNLTRRFPTVRPDSIGVIDLAQETEARAAGFDDVVITGHPALSAIQPAPPRPAGETVSVLFVSERIAADVAEGVNDSYGFDETDSFSLVMAAAERAASGGQPVEVTVKFHPYNDPDAFRDAVGATGQPDNVRLIWIEGRQPIAPLIEAADIVAGISSVALVEASLMGRVVVSVQPGLTRENMFVPGERGFADTLINPEQAITRLCGLMTDPAGRQAARDRLSGFRSSLSSPADVPIQSWLKRVLPIPLKSAIASAS
ncbi:hypothetical protein GH722_04510 [Alphaproteobacteria bacterium HT1-32]|nr:hypothetical protein [Alphaproteobacteria bacterium HT1-32]